MREPQEFLDRQTAARAAAKIAAKELHPRGKVLARIKYFEKQRGLDRTNSLEVRVETVSLPKAVSQTEDHRKSVKAPKVQGSYYAGAYRAKAKLEPNFPSSVGLPVWKELGPLHIPKGQTYGKGGNNQPPVSGRANGIIVDPSDARHLVLCSAGGGLWGSHDAGVSWIPLTDEQPSLSMGAIANAPSSPNMVYAATGEGDTRSPLGVGLLRSADGGLTWTHILSNALAASNGIYDIAVDPVDPLHLWIASVAGIYESRDGGATVTHVRTAIAWDISIHRGAPQEILIAAEDGLLRSTDGGSTFSRVSLPNSPQVFERLEVCHAPSDPGVAYVAGAASTALLWRRDNASGDFVRAKVPQSINISQAWYDWCFGVSPADPDLVFWGAIELYRGRRVGGTFSWENISSRSSGDSIHPDQHDIGFDANDPKALYVCNDGGLFVSPDEGNTWSARNPGLRISEFEFLAQLESEDKWVIGGTQDNGTLSNKDTGTWDQIALGDGGDCGTEEGNGTPTCYHSYYGMWIERADALGANAFEWENVSPPFNPNTYPAQFYPPMDVLGPIVAKAGISVFVSPDRGASWEEVALPDNGEPEADLASALTIVDATTILVATDFGRLFQLKRGAGGWGAASVTLLTSPRKAYLSDVVALPGAQLWASSSAVGGGHVFRSLNNGKTWADRSGNLPDIPVNAVVVDPADVNRVFAATDNGVYETKNAGTTWADFSNGLPNVLVGDLILHSRRRLLRAGTRNRGVWEVAI